MVSLKRQQTTTCSRWKIPKSEEGISYSYPCFSISALREPIKVQEMSQHFFRIIVMAKDKHSDDGSPHYFSSTTASLAQFHICPK